MLNKAILNAFIEHVTGSSADLETESLEMLGIRMMDMDKESQDYILERVFECEVCNWICSTDERSENEAAETCQDCETK